MAMTEQVALTPHLSAGQIICDATAVANPEVVAHETSGPSVKRGLRWAATAGDSRRARYQ